MSSADLQTLQLMGVAFLGWFVGLMMGVVLGIGKRKP